MSKYCEQCGAELSDEEKFCPQCGTDVIDEEERYQIQKDTDEAIEAEQSPVSAEEPTAAAGQAPEQPVPSNNSFSTACTSLRAGSFWMMRESFTSRTL